LGNALIQDIVKGQDGKTLFAATGSGVYQSTDGLSWQQSIEGLSSPSVQALLVEPGGSLLAGTATGLFRSHDEGKNWQAMPSSGSVVVRTLIMGLNGQRLVMGTLGKGVLASDDGGESWQPINQGLSSLNVRVLKADQKNQALYAGTLGGGLFRFETKEQRWRPLNDGLTTVGLRDFAINQDGRTLFAGTRLGVFRSHDGGTSWNPANQGLLDLDVQSLLLLPESGRLLIGTFNGGIFRSDDSGDNWQTAGQGLGDQDVRSLLQTGNGRTVLAGTSGGVYRSDDAGQSWRETNVGLSSLAVRSLSLATDGHTLLLETYSGHYRSDDDGYTWNVVTFAAGDSILAPLKSGQTQLQAADSTIDLARPGIDWPAWATYQHQPPVAYAVEGNRATLYAPAGAALLLRAETAISPLWLMPAPYLKAILQTRAWVDSLSVDMHSFLQNDSG
jgi:photosystem II stability/assembly factor-like uncharacterized protein